MQRSKLNAQCFFLPVVDSHQCIWVHEVEESEHVLFKENCPRHQVLQYLHQLYIPDVNLETMLFFRMLE